MIKLKSRKTTLKQISCVLLSSCLTLTTLSPVFAQTPKPFWDQNLQESFSTSLQTLKNELGDVKAGEWGAIGDLFGAEQKSIFAKHNKILVGQLLSNIQDPLRQIDGYDRQLENFARSCQNELFDEILSLIHI